MGIHGLSYYITSFPNLIEKAEWKLDSSDLVDQFIFDGNAFVYHIAFQNRTNWTHGGQYAMIAEIVTKTVQTLSSAGIEPTFLFDGALPKDKLDTRLKRHRSYIDRCISTYQNLGQINASNKDSDDRHNGIQYYGDLFLIPPLTLEVVVQTLRELNVQVKICQAEADGEVVTLANQKNAYVVSQDSDMYVYPRIGKGYIPFELLKIPLNKDSSHISAGVYHPDRLSTMLNLETCFLPLVGTLLGNDYLDVDSIRPLIGQWCSAEGLSIAKNSSAGWPKIVAELIKKNLNNPKDDVIRSIAEQLSTVPAKSNSRLKMTTNSVLQDRMIDSISRYDLSSPLLKSVTTNVLKHLAKGGVHLAYDDQTKDFSRQLLDVIESKTFWTSIFLEDIEREYSWDVSRLLRQSMYTIALHQVGRHDSTSNSESMAKVEEYVRVKHHLEGVRVITDNISQPTLDFYMLHQSNRETLNHLNTVTHPLVLCLRYLIFHCSRSIKNGRLYNYEVVGMLISGLRSLAVIIDGLTKDDAPFKIDTPKLKKRCVHLAAQFQSVIYSSYLLSQTLDMPDYMQSPHLLANLYNGVYFHHYIELARNGASIGKMLSGLSEGFKSLFFSVYEAVMSDLESEVHTVFDYKLESNEDDLLEQKPKRVHSKKQESNRPEKKKKSLLKNQSRNTNAFNVLSFGCTFDE
ncbi:Protein asteroid 1 [Choanephora cucurbitarum]|uniref:Protein asteroid 1 n=1 Tax=Choanephora cucurbitarum TaxID=101091 RepID=A0A1C7NDD4_9FUNG|nr:Protein asteroid 1 [Choanephora cucurbitarum]